jgi:hypothetical protein
MLRLLRHDAFLWNRLAGITRIGHITMPAKSRAQQKAAGAALAAKRGEIKKSELKGASREMVETMTESELEALASTRHKGKPEHVSR